MSSVHCLSTLRRTGTSSLKVEYYTILRLVRAEILTIGPTGPTAPGRPAAPFSPYEINHIHELTNITKAWSLSKTVKSLSNLQYPVRR